MAKIADVQEVSLEKLRPYERNAKKHGAGQIEKLKASIIEFGFLTPCLIDSEYNLIAGHGRVMAAKELGIETVPCVFIEGLTEEQRRAYVLADNRLGELGEWDMELVFDELKELDDLGFDIELTGFEMPEEIPEVIEDNFDEDAIPDEPRTKLGDLWQLGDHRLICGDSTDVTVIDRLMDGEKAKLLLTDPPYNVDYSAKNKALNAVEGGNRIEKDIENDLMSDEQFEQFLYGAFYNADGVMESGAAFYIWHADKRAVHFINAINKCEWNLKQILVWVKNNIILGMQDYQYRHEPCLYGWKNGAHYFVNDRTQQTVINEDKPVKNNMHPTMKPVNLMARLIQNSSREGESVLDLFGGSGSTLIACEQLNRKCFMCELDPHYCDVIINRWETFTGREAVLING